MRFIVTLTKTQAANPTIVERANYFLKAYEKDSFVIPIDNLARDIAKYHSSKVDIATLGSTFSRKTMKKNYVSYNENSRSQYLWTRESVTLSK